MSRITVEDCISKIPNHFDLTLAAARRARQLEMAHRLWLMMSATTRQL